MKVAAIQFTARVGQVEENVGKALSLLERAVAEGAELVVFPELFPTGYFPCEGQADPNVYRLAEPADGGIVQRFAESAKAHRVHLVVPFFERDARGAYYNSAAVIAEDGTVAGVYRKTHVPMTPGVSAEKIYFRPGERLEPIPSKWGPLGILICYDRMFPEAARALALQGARILLIPSAVPAKIAEKWGPVLRVRAMENAAFVVGVNLCGQEHASAARFVGQSAVIDPFGHVLAEAGEEEAVITAEIDLEQVEHARQALPVYRDRRDDLYAPFLGGSGTTTHRKMVG